MSEIHKITSLDAVWKPGDVVLDADSNLWVRTDDPKWVWGYPGEGDLRDRFGNLCLPEGSVEESSAKRPLTLLVRDGEAVGGVVVPESASEIT